MTILSNGEEFPDQDYIPSVRIRRRRGFGTTSGFRVQAIPYDITPVNRSLSAGTKTGFGISRTRHYGFWTGATLTRIPTVYAGTRTGVTITRQDEPIDSPNYNWEFEDTGWADSVTGLAFIDVLEDVSLVSGYSGNAAQLGSSSSALRTTEGAIEFDASQNWSLSLRFKFTDQLPGSIYLLRSEGWDEISETRKRNWYLFAASGSISFVVLSGGASSILARVFLVDAWELDIWYQVEITYQAGLSGDYPVAGSISFADLADTGYAVYVPDFFPLQDLAIGTNPTRAGLTVDDLQIYKEEL